MNEQITATGAAMGIVIVCLAITVVVLTSGRHSLDERLDAVLKDRDKYRSLAEEAMTYLDSLRTRLRVAAGEADFTPERRVQPVRHSDPTRIAEDEANVQSLDRRLKAIVKDIDRLSQERD
jgi:hypothetical protein